jgi:hypothetical protein
LTPTVGSAIYKVQIPVSPFQEEELQYIVSFDSNKHTLDGSRNYFLRLPPGIPASNFWSVIVYDKQSRLIIPTDQSWPSIYSSLGSIKVNQDGSIDTWFGPEAPKAAESNWVKTIPGKSWYLILRLYYPLEAWYNKSWRPGEIEEVNLKCDYVDNDMATFPENHQ